MEVIFALIFMPELVFFSRCFQWLLISSVVLQVVERRGIQCTCLFLDHGDQDTVPVEDLREIPPKFLDLPAQGRTRAQAVLK